MDEISVRSNKIENYVHMVSNELESIDSNNLNEKIDNVKDLIEKINIEREFLIANYSIKGGVPKCDELHRAVKHVISQFDNIIERKKELTQNIIAELNKLANKKKLINYQR